MIILVILQNANVTPVFHIITIFYIAITSGTLTDLQMKMLQNITENIFTGICRSGNVYHSNNSLDLLDLLE